VTMASTFRHGERFLQANCMFVQVRQSMSSKRKGLCLFSWIEKWLCSLLLKETWSAERYELEVLDDEVDDLQVVDRQTHFPQVCRELFPGGQELLVSC